MYGRDSISVHFCHKLPENGSVSLLLITICPTSLQPVVHCWCSGKFAEWKRGCGGDHREIGTIDYFACLKHRRTEPIRLPYIRPFNTHLNPLRFCQDRPSTKQQRGGNALSICYCQSGNMTLTQCNMVNLDDRRSSSVPRHLHCNFTIQKTPVIGREWNIWMLQTLSTGCLYHHLQNRCTRNESFLSSRNPGWHQNTVFNPLLREKQGLSGFPQGVSGNWDLAIKESLGRQNDNFILNVFVLGGKVHHSHHICEMNKWIP